MLKLPDYRFTGYTVPWEEKKLSDGISKIGDGIHGTPVYSKDGDYYFINGNNLVDGKIFLFPETKKVQSNQLTVSDTSLKKNTILMSINGTIGSLAWYRDEKVMLGKSVAYLTTEEFNRKFIYSILQTPKIVKHFNNNLTGTTIKNLGLKTIRDTVISLPSLPEQTAIGSFFQDIDQLINLQQRKLEVLKEQKKTYLKLLFPAKGQTKPALRFAGFEDDWKEVKLGEVVASERKGKAKSEMIGNKSVYLDTIYLNGGEQTRVDCDCDTSKEDIIILWDGSQAGAVYYGFEGALGSTLKSYKIFGSGSFYYQQMKASQSLIFERYRTPNIPHVIKSFLDDFYIFTTSLPEQQAIGSFFQDLDKAISKQEEKVNQLKESKQTLLRKMFI
ncbi:restriction endonuclease subunit S [Streptococcus sp. oral taxon 061]|jgi:hypothetical protein|uniref:restriction endonuclease subunit S n=1 Tax=Streptococcus sp. oral taxon 061 TaxID=712623 RepID=UPI0015BB7AEC|nr:restriction endonuclease subunit S [Streptococcus sp. oral taxon 061]QLF55019.1 restriction endonuclease subunit S [Streptococcus sp. oral taxon 061]